MHVIIKFTISMYLYPPPPAIYHVNGLNHGNTREGQFDLFLRNRASLISDENSAIQEVCICDVLMTESLLWVDTTRHYG